MKVKKIIKDNPDKEKVLYEVEKTKVEVQGMTLEHLRESKARFQAMIDAIEADIAELEKQ